MSSAKIYKIIFVAVFFLPRSAAAQTWFPAGAVRCNLSNPTINLGVFSRITDPAPTAEGSFNISCESNAYPAGYPASYRTVEGGYCLNVLGAQGSRVLNSQGKNANISIPFDFFNSTHKQEDPNRPQDFNTPIGDGTWGIAFFDWDYRDGDINRPPPPSQGRNYYSVPVKSLFEIRIKPIAAGRAYPAGIYANNFTFQ